MKCRWDREAAAYLRDGEPCTHDDYGDPTRHCTARRNCANHIGPGELTCPRCIGRTRADIARIRDLSALMLPAAIGAGVESEAANLAGPAADPEAWMWHQVRRREWFLARWKVCPHTLLPAHQRTGLTNEEVFVKAWKRHIEDDDERNPYNLLGRWEMMLREDYDHPSDEPMTITGAAGYLDRQLGRVAQDPTQDFPLFSREMRKCRNHLEGVIRNSNAPEKGAPCPRCLEEGQDPPRLTRHYGHWCEDPECAQQFHFIDEAGDEWRCPRDPKHRWTHAAYSAYVEERRAG